MLVNFLLLPIFILFFLSFLFLLLRLFVIFCRTGGCSLPLQIRIIMLNVICMFMYLSMYVCIYLSKVTFIYQPFHYTFPPFHLLTSPLPSITTTTITTTTTTTTLAPVIPLSRSRDCCVIRRSAFTGSPELP